ncbi:hypothetical protein SANTM175S_08086 [Streptomyces antimycoticus]
MSDLYQHGTGDVLTERHDNGVLLITINRPDRYNSLSSGREAVSDLINFQPTRTLPGLLLDRARKEPDAVALRYWRDGSVQAITWRAYANRVREVALGLVAQGVKHGDRVAVMSSARPEWACAALAVQSVGGVVIGVYPPTRLPR